jgi:MFS family permease
VANVGNVSPKAEQIHASSPWARSEFRWFFVGQSISVLGGALSPVALSLATLDASGKSSNLAVVLVAQSVPMLVFLVIGGAMADRVRRTAVLVFSNLGAGLTQGAVAAVLITGNYHLGLIAGLEVLNGTCAAFTSPALRGIIPQLVDKTAQQRANAAVATSKNLAKVIGPAFGGIIVVSIGGGWAVAIDGASYLIAAFCMTRLALPPIASPVTRKLISDIREGWSEFRRLPWVVVIVTAFTLTNCILGGVWMVLGPTIARVTIGETSWGIVLSSRAIGLLAMGLVMYRVTVRRLLAVGQLCAVLFAIQLVVLGLKLPAYYLIIAAFIGGLGSAVSNISWDTSLQEHVAQAVLSRVASYDTLGSYAAVPIGELAVIPIAAAAGQYKVAVIGGFLYAAIALAALASSSVRKVKHAV